MEKKEIGFVESSHPILEIAYKPRRTVRFVLENKSLKYAIGIAVVGGFSSTLSGYIGTKYNYSFSFVDILLSSFSIGALASLLSILLLAVILTYAGRFLKGKGTFKEMLKGICLTSIPYIWILPLLLFWMQFSPQSFFVLPGVDNVLLDVILQFFGSLFLLVVAIWSFVIHIKVISVVHQFSNWKSLTILIVPALIVLGLSPLLNISFI